MKLLDVVNAPWAIMPDKLNEIREIYLTHLRGEKIDVQGLEARLGRDSLGNEKEFEVRDGVAIIPVEGVLGKKMNLFMRISGGSSTQIIKNQIETALEDESISAIILNVDSPGGTVDGTTELANFIFENRGRKPIVTFADGLMASAAYYIGSAADRILMSGETALIGSIGVVTTHVDVSTAENIRGFKTTEITAGSMKRIDSQFAPLSEQGRDALKSLVESLNDVMVRDIAKFRGVAVEKVIDDMANGRTFVGNQAIEAGLVDGVSTLDALVLELSESDGDSGDLSIISNRLSGDRIDMSKNETTENTERPELTAGVIALDYPDVFAEIKQQGFVEGQNSSNADAMKKGAEAERERIQAVENQSMPGHEKLIETLKYDGLTSGPEAAVQVLKAEKVKGEVKAQQIEEDAPEAVDSAEPALNTPSKESMTVEERAKAEWDSKPELRGEFTSLEAYTACLKAEEAGTAKVIKK